MNFADTAQSCAAGIVAAAGLHPARDALAPDDALVRDGRIHLARLALRWLTADLLEDDDDR